MTAAAQARRDLFDLVSGFAGRLPDDDLAVMRSVLAAGRSPLVLEQLCAAIGSARLRLTKDEQDSARRICESHGVDSGPVTGASAHPLPEVTDFSFSAPDLRDERASALDEAVVHAAVGFDSDGGDDAAPDAGQDTETPLVARAMWRVSRFSGGDSAEIRLVELLPGADPVEVTGRVQDRLLELREDPPRVEVFAGGAELGRYHEEALANATLIWVAEEPAPPRVAAVYDGVDPHGEPFFLPDHPRIPEAEQAGLAGYLSGGERILGSDGWIGDIVTAEEVCVPTGYRSDGEWVWPDATLYYLERHGLAPDPGLRAHIARGGTPPALLSRLQRHVVLDVLLDREPPQ